MGLFIVQCVDSDEDGDVFGPFASEEDAAEWVRAEGSQHEHKIRRLVEP